MASYWEILPHALLGILAGFIVLGFVRFFRRCEDFFAALKLPAYLKPALGGIVVGLIALYYFDIFGVGYGGSYGVSAAFIRGCLEIVKRGYLDRSLGHFINRGDDF